jgi:hypothetical protein
VQKFSRDSRQDRSGRTYRGYNTRPENVPKRQHNTIEDFEGVDGHTARGSGVLTLDKDKRWEVVEQLKKDPRYHIVERDRKDTRMQRVQIDQKIDAIVKLRNRAAEGHEVEETNDDMSVDEEEKFKKEYRVTKGGPNGVMISKRRRPGKKGIKKQEDKTSKSSSSGSEEASDDSMEDKRVGYVVVERMDKHIVHDTRRKGNSWCRCEACNPVEPHYERAKQKRELLSELKQL